MILLDSLYGLEYWLSEYFYSAYFEQLDESYIDLYERSLQEDFLIALYSQMLLKQMFK